MMVPGTWRDWAAAERDAVHAQGRWRAPRSFDAQGVEGTLAPDGDPVVSFASNDYLGLTRHPAVVEAAHHALDRWGTGAGAARLIVGARPVHEELEQAIAAWKQCPSAVLFGTGFAANLGVLTTFGGPDVLVCSDELNHASIVDGRLLAGSELAVYPHLDAAYADKIMDEARRRSDAPRLVLVSETVFSMDGDVAPVRDLMDVCARHGALLVLDEAHAVLGPEVEPDPAVDVLRVGTLSKTLGALGGFVAGATELTELLVNRARSYIFTTASTPADSAAALAAIRVLRSPEGDELRARLRTNIDRLRPGHPSPIIPYLCGDEQRALAVAERLLAEGFLCTGIRPPTVPPGTSRLRVTVSAAHSPDQVDRFARLLHELFPAP
jgi:8-amino-7-oxononanoate synthase